MIYQYIFFRPFIGVLNCVLYYNDLLHSGGLRSGNPLSMGITLFSFFSLVIAMWALLQVYRTFALILKPNNVGSKFLALKVYIWFHVIQGFVFGFIESRQPTPQKEMFILRIEYTVLCVEMLLGAILNLSFFFKYQEYVDGDETKSSLTYNKVASEQDPLLASSP